MALGPTPSLALHHAPLVLGAMLTSGPACEAFVEEASVLSTSMLSLCHKIQCQENWWPPVSFILSSTDNNVFSIPVETQGA